MRTLDEILSEKTRIQYEDRLAQHLDPNNWTEENRNEQVASAYDIISEIGQVAESFVKQALDTKIDNESIISIAIRKELIYGMINLFQSIRANLDTMSDEEMKSTSYDYDWLTYNIKLLLEIADKDEKAIANALAVSPVEEL